MKLFATERKVCEYTGLDSVLCTELLVTKGDLQSLLSYLNVDGKPPMGGRFCPEVLQA